MELTGIGVDVDALAKMSVELADQIALMVVKIHETAGETFNINSTQQLAKILFDKRGHTPIKKTKSGFSTDSATLNQLMDKSDDEILKMILEYRAATKLKNTYVDALPDFVAADGRIHTSYHQAVAATGRLSSFDPNLQNIPIRILAGKRIRGCFKARPGYQFLAADYSQIELRVLAHFCKDGPLVEAFVNGDDIHSRTAAEIFGIQPDAVTRDQRSAAKAINFGIIYGMSAFRLARELKISRTEAQRYIDNYFARYPQVRTYMDDRIQEAKDHGVVKTLFGRQRVVRGLSSRNNNERAAAERVAMNTPVQGTAADLIKMAMIKVHERLKADFPRASLLLQVHDELVLEVPEEDLEAISAALVEEMQGVYALGVPLLVETGHGATWDAAH
jgi:DNA polymerase-1